MHANYRSSSLEMWFVGLNDIVHKKTVVHSGGKSTIILQSHEVFHTLS